MPTDIDTSKARTFAFEGFTIDLARSTLSRDGVDTGLRRQSFDVLKHLIDGRGRVVGTDELLDAVWPGRPAQSASSVVQCIKDIRSVLGDDARWMIRTVPGKGYEFKAEVHPVPARDELLEPAAVSGETPPSPPGEAGEASPSDVASNGLRALSSLVTAPGTLVATVAAILFAMVVAGVTMIAMRKSSEEAILLARSSDAPATMMAIPSVMVLPFTIDHAGSGSIGTTIAGEIRNELLITPRGFDISIKTADVNPNLPLATIAQKLDVRYAVTGTVRDEDTQRVIVAQLIEAATGSQIWAEQFRYPSQEAGALNMLAARIARALGVQIRTQESKRPLPQAVEAGHLNLQARVILESQRDEAVTRRAKALYDQAVAMDGNNVQSLQGYTRTRADLVGNSWHGPHERVSLLAEADQAIEHALRIDPRSSGAHLLRGVLARINGNFDRAVASFEYVCELNPTYFHAYAELGRAKIEVGRANESIPHIERAFLLSPTDPVGSFWAYWAGMAAAHAGDFPATIKWMLKSQQINSAYKRPLIWLAIAYAQTGDKDKAREALSEYRKAFPNFSLATWRSSLPTGKGVVAKQRERLLSILRDLGVSEAT